MDYMTCSKDRSEKVFCSFSSTRYNQFILLQINIYWSSVGMEKKKVTDGLVGLKIECVLVKYFRQQEKKRERGRNPKCKGWRRA